MQRQYVQKVTRDLLCLQSNSEYVGRKLCTGPWRKHSIQQSFSYQCHAHACVNCTSRMDFKITGTLFVLSADI